jgi:hypothetical protein
MANPEHLQILKQGIEAWNAWRAQHKDVRPNLTGTDLTGAYLRGAIRGVDIRGVNFARTDLTGATLAGAALFRAALTEADLTGATLYGADLSRAYLSRATLHGADLRTTNLSGATLAGATLFRADLSGTILTKAILTGADVSEVLLVDTTFGDTNLTAVRGLESCNHRGPSILDHRTLIRSGPLPLAFLRGCGLPDALIDYLPSLLNEPVQFYSCFISYASKDQIFAERLYADLQNKGVRCWFAPKDLPIGAKILVSIDESIRLYDKLLLVLSKSSVKSQWVEGEVATALARERQQGSTVLFPVRIDNTVMSLERFAY